MRLQVPDISPEKPDGVVAKIKSRNIHGNMREKIEAQLVLAHERI